MIKKILIALLALPSICFAQSAGGVSPVVVTSPELKCIAVTPTVEAAAYAAGDCLHASSIALASAARVDSGSGRVKSITIADKQGQAKNMTAVLFNSAPSTICAAINGAFDPADADLLLITAGGPIPISSHDAFSDNGLSFTTALDRSFKLASGTSLYLALIAEEAVTPAVGDYTVTVCVERD